MRLPAWGEIPWPLLLTLLAALSYLPALAAGFVWDDDAFLQAQAVQRWDGLWQIWFAPSTLSAQERHYWPLLYTTFWLEHKLWGLNPVGYHAVNLLLHGVVTVLLYNLLQRGRVPGAYLAAALFAVHPVHTEAVAWVIGRKDLLAALCYLAAALAYLRFTTAPHARHYAAAALWFIGALLCKSTAVTLPLALWVWHGWQAGRVTRADIMRVLPLLLLGLAITAADWVYYMGRVEAAHAPVGYDYSLIERILLAAHALASYLGQLLWPLSLPVIYPRWEVGVADRVAWICLAGGAALVVLLWQWRHRLGRGALAGVVLFALLLSPTLGFVDYGYMQIAFVADRYQYLASAAILAVLAAAAIRLATYLIIRFDLPQGRASMVVTFAIGALMVSLVGLSWQQASAYRDNITFFGHIAARNPAAHHVHFNLGLAYQHQGHFAEAHAAYATAVTRQPQLMKAHLGLGITAEKLGRATAAITHYQDALALRPRNVEVLDNLGELYVRQKRYGDALPVFRTLVELRPHHAHFHSGHGVALYGLRRYREALARFDRALALDPTLAQARINRTATLRALATGGG